MSESAPAPARRPFGVTLVMLLTWVVALLSILGGIALLLADASTLLDLGISKSTANTYGVIQMVFGVVVALVATGLANGNNFSRFLVSALMALRLAAAAYLAVVFWGTSQFWVASLAGLLALLILFMLWNGRASAFFRTN
jgi:hypothetical protein